HREDDRHRDGQDLEHAPDDHAERAQAHQRLVEGRGPLREELGSVHAAWTSTRPATRAAVAPYPRSTQAAPAATLPLTDTVRVAVPAWLDTFAIAWSATPMRRASSGLRVICGPRVSGWACSAAARRTTASLR